MKRRQFLKQAVPATAIFPSLLNGFHVKAFGGGGFFDAFAGASDNDHVLVLIQLSGGNDGLNTLIPLSNYGDYAGLRSNIAIPEGKVLPLSGYSKAGLNPAMSGMQSMYNNGNLSALFSVGYPEPNGSHFRSADIWLSGADSDQYLQTGWAGRFLSQSYEGFPSGYPNATMPDPLALQIGSVLSPVFMGPGGFTAMTAPADMDFYNVMVGDTDPLPDSPMGNELAYLRTVARQTNKYADVIMSAAAKAANKVSYPDSMLGNQLKAVARLIAGGLKTKVYLVQTWGFDTHGAQVQAGNPLAGTHAQLLTDLSQSISAFHQDLTKLGVSKRVMGMTFSEFGRRIISNGSFGTDHGAAQAVFVFGDKAEQTVLGEVPDLSSGITAESSLPMQFDFRSVYATFLRDWFCVDASDVTTTLYKNYQYLGFVEGSACTVEQPKQPDDLGADLLKAEPNPFVSSTVLEFRTSGGATMIQVFDTTGKLVAIPVEQVYGGAGVYRVPFDASRLALGAYYVRLQNGNISQVKTIVKVR